MASRDYTDGFISNAASTSKSNGYLPKFEDGSANALTDHLTGRFEDYSLGVGKSQTVTNNYFKNKMTPFEELKTEIIHQ